MNRLVDDGNTLIVIEHNLDVISQMDWIIDMGLDGWTSGVLGHAFADYPWGAVKHGKVLGIMHPITLIKGKTHSRLQAEIAAFRLINVFYLKIGERLFYNIKKLKMLADGLDKRRGLYDFIYEGDEPV